MDGWTDRETDRDSVSLAELLGGDKLVGWGAAGRRGWKKAAELHACLLALSRTECPLCTHTPFIDDN